LLTIVAVFTPMPLVMSAPVTVPVFDGMILALQPNLFQVVEVRAQSLGPGLCEVRFDFAGAQKRFQAPLLSWSDWMKIGGAMDGGHHALGFSPACSTGALGQVRYERAG
jgi:hypothetical protein